MNSVEGNSRAVGLLFGAWSNEQQEHSRHNEDWGEELWLAQHKHHT